MIPISETIYTPNEHDEGFLEYVRGGMFPWYSMRTLDDNHSPFQFCHALMKRDPSGEPVEGKISSPHWLYGELLFNNFCKLNKIEVNTIFRMAFNNTTWSPQKYVDPHTDHCFDHKVFLMYLNQFDGGQTYLMGEDEKISYIIHPAKYKAVVFNNCIHTHTFCRPDQQRLVMVATFN